MLNGLWLSSWKEVLVAKAAVMRPVYVAGTGNRGLELTAGEDTHSKALKALW
jgi:hypothetical protein